MGKGGGRGIIGECGQEERYENRKKGGETKVTFWNVARLGNKDEDFWRELGGWDVVCLMETWMEEKGWRRIEGKLPKGFIWEKQWAKKLNKKGRTMGDMLMGMKRGREEKR